MDNEDYENEDVEVVDDVSNDEATDDYLNEILTESQPNEEEPDEFEKNKEGVTGDEWKEEEQEKLVKEIKAENKRNAERRIREKQEKAAREEEEEESFDGLKDEDLDAAELAQVRERTDYLEKQMEIAAPVMDYLVQNNIGKQELELGVEFVNNWRADKIGCAKKLLTALEKEGIDVGRIVSHDDNKLSVMNEVNQRMQPIMQQRAEEARYVESKKLLDGFLDRYPDAMQHLEEITEVMRRSGSRDPYKAYFNLRRVYSQNNESWYGEQPAEEYFEDEEPQVISKPAEAYDNYQPQNYRSIGDVVSSEARKIFRRF